MIPSPLLFAILREHIPELQLHHLPGVSMTSNSPNGDTGEDIEKRSEDSEGGP